MMSVIKTSQLYGLNTPHWLCKFQMIYQNLSKDNLLSLKDIYHDDIVFQDPLHKVEGLTDFIAYFENLYTHVTSCTFEITHIMNTSNEAAVYWEMRYQHPKLNSGKMILVTGHSHIKSEDGKVIYQRDFLDVGAMIYEHVPLLGKVIRYLKQRMNK